MLKKSELNRQNSNVFGLFSSSVLSRSTKIRFDVRFELIKKKFLVLWKLNVTRPRVTKYRNMILSCKQGEKICKKHQEFHVSTSIKGLESELSKTSKDTKAIVISASSKTVDGYVLKPA